MHASTLLRERQGVLHFVGAAVAGGLADVFDGDLAENLTAGRGGQPE